MEKQPLQWHPAFCSILQIELEGEPLIFQNEYNLTRKPLQIDVLIIKKTSNKQVKKSIGRIFRKHNIVEFKSPEDYLSINDYYKVLGYAGIYQSNTKKILEIKPEEITLTFVTNHYPQKMMEYLKMQYRIEITETFPGIYYLFGLPFATQVILIKKLSKQETLWLSRLRPDLSIKDDLEVLTQEYKDKMGEPLYVTGMDVIIRANKEKIEKEESEMCDALRELFADEFEAREEQGRKYGEKIGREEGAKLILFSQVCKKLIKEKSESEIADELEVDLALVRQICEIAKEFAPEYPYEDIYKAWQKQFCSAEK